MLEYTCEGCGTTNLTGQACLKCNGTRFGTKEIPNGAEEPKFIRVKVDFITDSRNQPIFTEIDKLIHELKTIKIMELSCNEVKNLEPVQEIKIPEKIIKKVWY